ncbi:telomere binding protein [Ascosphaera pollenicola]|nr:telomere binding protein [Ascosphaera pollenicola]
MPSLPSSEPEHVREKARRELLDLLEGVRGKKNLVISKDLAGPVGLVVKFSVLQEYGVDRVFLLENANVDSSQKNVIFIVRAEKPDQIKLTTEQIRRLQASGTEDNEFSIFWTPRRTFLSNQILEDEGITGDVSVYEYPLYFFPLDDDVLSLELADSFSEIYLHQDPNSIHLASKALMQVQMRHGLFPRIIGQGDNARALADQLLRMRKEVDAEETSGLSDASKRGLVVSPTVEALIVLDRSVDFATPLMSQLTYGGLIDELYEITNNQIEVDSTVIGATATTANTPGPNSSKKKKVQLDSSDKLYSQLRDANFAIVGGLLNKVARRLESEYERRHNAKSTSELRDFVNKLPAYQAEHGSLKIHTDLAEEVMRHTRSDIFRKELEIQQNIAAGADAIYQHDKVEELISRDVPLTSTLRLLCLESCFCGGFRPKDLELFKRQVLQAYGYQHLLTLDALEKLGLLQSRSSPTVLMLPTGGASGDLKTNYAYLRKSLRLIMDEVDEQNPNDVAYVYSGYAPLSIRLIQCALQGPYLQSVVKGIPPPTDATPPSLLARSWSGFDSILRSARGATFNIAQASDEKILRARQTLTGDEGVKTVFIFFLGGITFAEISALRFIGQKEASRRKIVICTTGIISGSRMIDQAMENGTFQRPVAAQ